MEEADKKWLIIRIVTDDKWPATKI